MSDVPDRVDQPVAEQVDASQVQFALEQLRAQQNLLAGSLAGLAASLVGAGAWAVVTIISGFQIGWMAVGVGFLVGLSIRTAGRGIDSSFGVVGATLALLGCALGNLLAVCGIVARQQDMAFMDVIARLNPSIVKELMAATFSPMDLVFYGIAIYEGYKLSFRQVTEQEMKSLLPGR